MAQIISKAPGRICLFGDHQDYLGLPVIACAINRHVWVKGVANNTGFFNISFPDLNEKMKLHCHDNESVLKKGEHIKAVLNVLRRYGCTPDTGYDLVIQGDLPVNAGLSSSSAMIVAWAQWLLATFGCEREITARFIGEVSYEAEVLEQNSPGGKMDQYTSALGDIIYLETDSNSKILHLGSQLEGLIIGESGIPKNTVGLLGAIKTKALKALSIIKNEIPGFNIHEANLTDYENYKELLPDPLRPYFYAAIQNHLITRKALAELQQDLPDYLKIGRLMNAHHKILKDILHITVPLIDSMVSAAIDAGAYGAKIVGSGGGGSIVAISDPKKVESIVKAIKSAGAKDVYTVKVTQGCSFYT